MKPLLRILVILVSIGIVAVALRPPKKAEKEDVTPDATAVPAEQSSNLIKDLLGGAAIESSEKAKDTISEVNSAREADFEESGL